jgi:RNA recognition motif-containing protein
VAKALECPNSKALNSNSSTAKKKKQAFFALLENCILVTCIIELKVCFLFFIDITHVTLDCRIRNSENGIHFLLNRDGKRRGDALIEMESEQDVQKALEKHRMYMGQRYVEGM